MKKYINNLVEFMALAFSYLLFVVLALAIGAMFVYCFLGGW